MAKNGPGKSPASSTKSKVSTQSVQTKGTKDSKIKIKIYEDDRSPESVTSPYLVETVEELSRKPGETSAVLHEENKSILWYLLKQVRPGMDLSKVSLPTFILEPRSFLDKLSDYYFHSDILGRAQLDEDPLNRLKGVVKWYLSGFYKKPRGLKKPYNPVLGETFRCKWVHPNGGSTYYVAEQVSHHPPVSSFYVSNRQEGFVIYSSILTKSKFSGNSTSAILEGEATLVFLPRREIYTLSMPFAQCKGLIVGSLLMELGGSITIECANTGYAADIEFKLKGVMAHSNAANFISGKIRKGNEVLGTLEGHWDNKVIYKPKKKVAHKKGHPKEEDEVFWEVNDTIKAQRLKRYTLPIEDQLEDESERLWLHVSEAIIKDDQEVATQEKTKLEERQRSRSRDRKEAGVNWEPHYFIHSGQGLDWRYKYEDLRPWDPEIDVLEFEENYKMQTVRVKGHRTVEEDHHSHLEDDKDVETGSVLIQAQDSSNVGEGEIVLEKESEERRRSRLYSIESIEHEKQELRVLSEIRRGSKLRKMVAWCGRHKNKNKIK